MLMDNTKKSIEISKANKSPKFNTKKRNDRIIILSEQTYPCEYSFKSKQTTWYYDLDIVSGIETLCVSPNNKMLFFYEASHVLYQYNIRNKKLIRIIKKRLKIYEMIITYDNKYLLTAEYPSYICKYDINTLKKIKCIKVRGIDCLVCSYNNKYLLAATDDSNLLVIDIEKFIIIKLLHNLNGNINAISVTADSKYAYFCDSLEGNSGKLQLLCLETLEQIKDFGNFTEINTNQICLTKDEKNILMGSEFSIRVFNIEKGEIIKELTNIGGCQKIRLIDDGDKALVADFGGDLYFIDLKTFEWADESLFCEDVTGMGCLHFIEIH